MKEVWVSKTEPGGRREAGERRGRGRAGSLKPRKDRLPGPDSTARRLKSPPCVGTIRKERGSIRFFLFFCRVSCSSLPLLSVDSVLDVLSVAYSIYSIGGCYTCYIVYYTIIVLHSVLDAILFLLFEHMVFSISARPGRGLAASSSTSNRVNSKWFKSQKKMELCYNIVL